MKKINILLLGGAGFIGSSLIYRFLLDDTYRISVLEPERANISRLYKFDNKILLHDGDLRDSAKILKILEEDEIDIVFHLVSTLIPGSALSHFQNEVADILMPSMNVMELCAERHIKFVYFSSGGTVYGNNFRGSHKEIDNKEPISYYGLSKEIVEEIVKFEHRHYNLDYLIFRPSNPYGPGQNIYGRQGLIAVSLGKILKNETLQIWGSGNEIRDYIYIDDLVDAIFKVIDSGISNETINVGSGRGYSVNEIVEIIDTLVHETIKVEHIKTRGVDVDSMILDCSKLYSIIDFSPIDVKTGIEKFIKYIEVKEKL